MKEKSLLKKILAFIVLDGVITTVLQFLINKALESYVDINVQFIIALLLGTVVVLMLGILVEKAFTRGWGIKKDMDIRNEINDLQLDMLQDFLEIRMETAFHDEWKKKIIDCANMKVSTNDHKITYQSIANKAQTEGVQLITKKDMDITLLAALLQHDFVSFCKVGATNVFKNHVRSVAESKNEYISHNSDLDNRLNNYIMQMTALKSIQNFVTYVGTPEFSWEYKELFIQEYDTRIKKALEHCYKNIGEQNKGSVELYSSINSYVTEIEKKAEDHTAAFVPLSYKKTDSSLNTYRLEQILDFDEGAILVADAGYGKTWSLIELAGNVAKQYMTGTSDRIPVFIEMGKLTTYSSTPVTDTINEEIFAGNLSEGELKEFIQNSKLILFIDGMDEASDDISERTRKELVNLRANNTLKILGGTRGDHRNKFPKELAQFSICDLDKTQLEIFIEKNISTEYREQALKDWISDENSYFKNLKTPFYITCYCTAINSGKNRPTSSYEIIEFCINGIVNREIEKGFKCSERIVDELLQKVSEKLDEKEKDKGREVHFVPEMEMLGYLEEKVLYDTKTYEPIPVVVDDLVELQILKRIEERRRYYIGFYAEQYRFIYAPDDDFF